MAGTILLIHIRCGYPCPTLRLRRSLASSTQCGKSSWVAQLSSFGPSMKFIWGRRIIITGYWKDEELRLIARSWNLGYGPVLARWNKVLLSMITINAKFSILAEISSSFIGCPTGNEVKVIIVERFCWSEECPYDRRFVTDFHMQAVISFWPGWSPCRWWFHTYYSPVCKLVVLCIPKVGGKVLKIARSWG